MTNPNHPRFQQALWYAFGQQDAGIGVNVDEFEFAKHYYILGGTLDVGAISFLPSIQDAWKQFLANATEETIRNIAPIADEVRDFLAKSIDDSMADLDAIDGGS